MDWDGWLTLGVLGFVFYGMVRNLGPSDILLLGGLVVLGLFGCVEAPEMFEGFINEGLLTIGALFVVAAGVRETGALDAIGNLFLGRARTEFGVLFRLTAVVPAVSAFLNNTPVVAMLMPVLSSWCKRHRLSPSRLFIPLSYLAILGGTCTLIGTSTNLVVNGYMVRERERIVAEGNLELAEALRPFGMFELTPLGVPLVLVGTLYIFTLGRRLLPDRKDLLEQLSESSRDYLVNMQIQQGCRLAGQRVEEAGLRHLPGLFLVEITREDQVFSPVRPDQILEVGDILTFTGIVSTIVDLERIPGLIPVADDGYQGSPAAKRGTTLCEAVVSRGCPLIGKSIRNADFRARYNAAVIAVHRNGERLHSRVGDIVLESGDTLLLQADPHFVRANRNNPDFHLVSGVEESRPLRHDKAFLATGFLLLLIVLLATRVLEPLLATCLVAGLLIGTRCVSAAVARQSIDLQLLLTIGAAIGLGSALEKTGGAEFLAGLLVRSAVDTGPLGLLAIVYLVTAALTETLHNAAAVTLMFPIAVATATHPSVDANPRSFVMAITIAAAASLVTPLGYQTNLMVYGPGGYRFTDFVKVGLPLSLLLMGVTVFLIPFFWPL